MRFDVSSLGHAFASRLRTLAAAAGATLAVGLALYALWPADAEDPADVVAVSGPVFTPVTMSRPARVSATDPSEAEEPNAMRFDRIRREDDMALTRAVQRELKRAGCYDRPVDGAWSAPTRKAMAAFTSLVNARLPVDHPDTVLLVLLESHPDASCTPACSDETGQACPARTSPAESGGEIADDRDDNDPAETDAASVPDAKAPEPSSQNSPAEAGGNTPEQAAAVAAGGAAALSAAAVATDGTSAAVEEPGATEPQRTTRKTKKTPSVVRSVQKGLKSLERSIKSMLP